MLCLLRRKNLPGNQIKEGVDLQSSKPAPFLLLKFRFEAQGRFTPMRAQCIHHCFFPNPLGDVTALQIPVYRAVANILVGATFGRPRAAIRRPYNVF